MITSNLIKFAYMSGIVAIVFAVLHDARISGVLREGGHAPQSPTKIMSDEGVRKRV